MSRNAPQLPNTTLTQTAVAVATSTGFNAGDLVYYKGSTNDFASPANLSAPSAVTFPYSPTSSVYGGTVGTSISAVFDTTTSFYGGSRSQFAAVLTNGNIVQVWNSKANSQPLFQIVDSSGASVVAPTVISATYLMSSTNNNIGVVALTGGGFAVYWVNASGGTANKPCYAVYSNTGSVVTAAVNDTSYSFTTTSAGMIGGTALSGGGFALGLGDSSNVATYFRGFSATGVGAYAWSPSIAPPNAFQLNAPSMAARSDGSFVLFNLGSAACNYMVVSAAGGTVTSGTFGVTSGKNNTDAAVLSDGMTVVFAYTSLVSSTLTPCFRILSSSNVLGAENNIPVANMNNFGTFAPNFNAVLGLSTGNFIFMFCDCMQQMQYVVYNSSGVAQSGTSSSGAVPKYIQGAYGYLYTKPTLIESGANIVVYWQNSTYTKKSWNTYTCKINKTTFEPVLAASTSQLFSTYSATTGAASLATATPNSVQYLAGATGTTPVSAAMRYILAPDVLTSTACSAISSTTLSDGRIAIAYTVYSTATIYVNIYTAAGVLQQTVTVGTMSVGGSIGSAGQVETMKIGAMTNGGFAVAYYSAANTSKVSIYSSAAALVASYTSVATMQSAGAGTHIWVCGLSDGNLLFGGMTSANTFILQVLNSTTGALIWSSSVATCAGNPALVANKSGGFATLQYNGTNTTINMFYKQNSTTYAVTGNTTISGAASTGTSSSLLTYVPGSGYYYSVCTANTSFNLGAYNDEPDILGNIINSIQSNATTSNNSAFGVTGNGSLVVAIPGTLYGFGSGLAATGSTIPVYTYPSTNAFTTTGVTFPSSGTSTSGVNLTSGFGDCVVMAWLNSSYYPSFAIIQAMPSQPIASYTSGVTLSQAVPVVPYKATTTNAVTNTVLSGVAATTATAGGTGLVQTNGLAQLNSSYPSGTVQNFDFQSPNGTAVSGVKGSVSGRNVTLQGTN